MAAQILIVDDDPNVHSLLGEILQAEGLTPIIAQTVAEARELAITHRPELVLLDIYLPDASGQVLLPFLRELDADAEVVVMTSSSKFEVVVEAMKHGASDFLCKPFAVDDAKQIIGQALLRRSKCRKSPGTILKTVLLVDSDARSLVTMGNLLVDHQIYIYQALDAAEARSILDTHTVDLVVADYSTPQAPGIEVLAETKRRVPSPPAILVTASDEVGLAIEALRGGAFDMVVKPIKKDVFNEAVLAAWKHKAVLEERTRLQRELDETRVRIDELEKALELERLKKLVEPPPHEPAPVVQAAEPVPVIVSSAQYDIQIQPPSAAQPQAEMTVPAEISSAPDAVDRKKAEPPPLMVSDRLAALGIMLTDLTRDLNGPLNIALGYTDLILRDTGDATKVRVQIEKIQSAIKKAGEIAGRLKRFEKVPTVSGIREVDVHLTIKTVIDLLSRKFELGAHSVQVELSGIQSTVTADPVEVQQVFANLMAYVSETLPRGGTVLVSTSVAAGQLEVRILDDGPGLTENQLSGLFDPSVEGESGQGLIVAKSAVEKNGGHVWAESKEGQGTMFVVRLPLSSTAPVNGSGPAEDPPPSPVGKSVAERLVTLSEAAQFRPAQGTRRFVGLVCDRTEGNESPRVWLENAGYEVHLCTDPESSLRSLLSEAPTLLVVDLACPGLDGPMLASELASRRPQPGLVLLGRLHTAYLSPALLMGIPHRTLEADVNQSSFAQAVEDVFADLAVRTEQ